MITPPGVRASLPWSRSRNATEWSIAEWSEVEARIARESGTNGGEASLAANLASQGDLAVGHRGATSTARSAVEVAG